MQLYQYTAKRKSGEIQKGEIEAENESAAAKLLSSKNLTTISVVPLNPSNFKILGGISGKDKSFLMRQLSTMINAGLPIDQSLKTLQDQASKKAIKDLLEQLSSDIQGGGTLSSSMARFPTVFSPLDVTLIKAGETSGNLDKALAQMAHQLEKRLALTRKIRGALVYPLFVIVVAIGIVGYVVIVIVPQMQSLYETFGKELPVYTKIMVSMSKFLGSFWWLLLAFIASLVAFLRYWITTESGRKTWDNIKINIPSLKILIKKLYMARFARVLSGLISSGVALLDALSITSDSIGNVIYRDYIKDIAEKVKGGTSLGEATKESELFPAVVHEMISVGEKTGELDKMLENLADYFEEEVDEAVNNISNLILPLFIIILGAVIGFIVLGTMMPIYDFARNIG